MSQQELLLVVGIDDTRLHLKAPDGRPLALPWADMKPSHLSAIQIARESGVKNYDGTAPANIYLIVDVQKDADDRYLDVAVHGIKVANDE